MTKKENEVITLEIFKKKITCFSYKVYHLKDFNKKLYDFFQELFPDHTDERCWVYDIKPDSESIDREYIFAFEHFEDGGEDDIINLSVIMNYIRNEYVTDTLDVILLDTYWEKLIISAKRDYSD